MDPEAAAFLNVIALIAGIFLTLRAVVRMDRYHVLRVVVLTVVFTCVTLYIFSQLNALVRTSVFMPDCDSVF
jgi:hypothetical protein